MRKEPLPTSAHRPATARSCPKFNLRGTSLLMSLSLGTLLSCSFIEEVVKPLDPKNDKESYSPTPGNRPVVPITAAADKATFIDPTATLTGEEHILLGQKIYIGPFARLLADDSHHQGGRVVAVGYSSGREAHYRINIGQETNLQDNVTIYAGYERDADNKAKVATLGLNDGVEIGERVILAHGCTVKGPARIGVGGANIPADPDDDQEVFLSFACEIDGAILEKNTGVSALGRVGPGVRLRSGFIVLPGKNVTTQAEADNPALGKVRPLVEADIEFNEAVLEVNIALAREYTRLYRENPSNVKGINYDPGNTAFNPDRNLPELGGGPTRVPGYRNRIIGEVYMDNSFNELMQRLGSDISIRADEGEPFTIGEITRMGDGVIFHALEEQSITVGDHVTYGERSIVHGGGRVILGEGSGEEPTVIEDDVVLEDEAIVFRSLIGKGARVGKKSAVVNSTVKPGQVIPDRTIYANDRVAGPVEW